MDVVVRAAATTPMPLGEWKDEVLWILIVGFIVAFFLAFGVGANDVANQFGTSVGAKVISLRNACILATIFELMGAILIGSRVSDTIRKKIVDVAVYDDNPKDYMLGNLAALGGSATWLLVATFFNMPISGTHSIVGSVLGFSVVAKGFDGISWWELGKIVLSWFVSPLLSGCISGLIFYGINRFILQQANPIKRGLFSLPIFYGITVLINIASILLDGPDFLQIKTDLPDWTEPAFGFIISAMVAIAVTIVVAIFMVPHLRKQIDAILASDPPPGENEKKSSVFIIETSDVAEAQTPINEEKELESQMVTNTFGFIPELNHNYEKDQKSEQLRVEIPQIRANNSGVPLVKDVELGLDQSSPSSITTESTEDGITFPGAKNRLDDDQPAVGKLFSFLQILTAAFGSFAHGGNDVSNAIGPLIALYLVYQDAIADTSSDTPIWLLIYGGVGISVGLWVWGRRVIKTMGEDLTKITPSSGFTIEIGSAFTVLLASKIGVPVSTTHCKVGSVVIVGWIRTRGGVDWSLFRNIVFAWVITLPISGGLSALFMWILQTAVN